MIVATANKLARIRWAVLLSGEDYRPMQPLRLPARRSGLKFASQKSADEKERQKHTQMACPRTCVEIRPFHKGGDYQTRARIIIMLPETILHLPWNPSRDEAIDSRVEF